LNRQDPCRTRKPHPTKEGKSKPERPKKKVSCSKKEGVLLLAGRGKRATSALIKRKKKRRP